MVCLSLKPSSCALEGAPTQSGGMCEVSTLPQAATALGLGGLLLCFGWGATLHNIQPASHCHVAAAILQGKSSPEFDQLCCSV
ncbi:hypothetical protein DUNSADRAFT_2861 [Dunaliella salina]|uniref:Uncharacterized protein n=1 Tax=Dunaliella salina TaxID=3046 RepID=A0ABQ7GV99_DUNSA|nr:hypothetical protein DUNSADRAFT_2861 [Dunaliella salina]|eukprot:KAF5838467.1 hypothetical protein DUNSADRAFT_2861 [Dunaliella salina]